ncbi:4171_t:CDS:2 [Paraglomus occultum]|uniref:4171_t:CDS:1 n=1 Tax=Paraglomus occultum TaxID=144539 RepID=A0A9N9G6J0_9GLOM|nr:4171_t:CDS:2 [Paraglomus occultum]
MYRLEGARDPPFPGTPEDYINLYSECWDEDPDKRPSCANVYERLKNCPQESSTDGGSNDEEADNRKENIQRKLHALTTSIEEGVMFVRALCNRLDQA